MNIFLEVMSKDRNVWDVASQMYFQTKKEAKEYALTLKNIQAYWIMKLDERGHYKTIEIKAL